MKRLSALLLTIIATTAHAAAVQPGGVQLLCHRTANKDVPENTLESLEQAALLGCNVVEIDLRRTLDGKIVLNHDGILERLTDGTGEVEKSYYDDLRMRDAGSWMGERFAGMHMALFEDALRLARQQDIRLTLDIKTKDIGVNLLPLLQSEGMLERVDFSGESSDVKQLYPAATSAGAGTTWVQPGVTAEQVKALHRDGKAVIANFSANDHDMDLTSMKAAVAAGVDGINVDYPRLGAEAVGRPVERKLSALTAKASAGEAGTRATAILELSRYRGFPLQDNFARWLLDPEDRVSRAAAVALVTAAPRTPSSVFDAALQSDHADARANAAWALGQLDAPATSLLPLLKDSDPRVLQETLMALSRAPGNLNAEVLLPFLASESPAIRGAAAVALARHQPEAALQAIPPRLRTEMKEAVRLGDDYERRGRPHLTQAESDEIMGHFRCQMKMMQALSMLNVPGSTEVLEELAFRPGDDSAGFDSMIASFQLWDRTAGDPRPAVKALGSTDMRAANRAEWMLVNAGPAVLPEVRKALHDENVAIRGRAISIVAWQGDAESLETLRAMRKIGSADSSLEDWAIEKIESFHPRP
jgi:glycerophosphoryl diester phosphodiesterase/HEAT repeat protein